MRIKILASILCLAPAASFPFWFSGGEEQEVQSAASFFDVETLDDLYEEHFVSDDLRKALSANDKEALYEALASYMLAYPSQGMSFVMQLHEANPELIEGFASYSDLSPFSLVQKELNRQEALAAYDEKPESIRQHLRLLLVEDAQDASRTVSTAKLLSAEPDLLRPFLEEAMQYGPDIPIQAIIGGALEQLPDEWEDISHIALDNTEAALAAHYEEGKLSEKAQILEGILSAASTHLEGKVYPHDFLVSAYRHRPDLGKDLIQAVIYIFPAYKEHAATLIKESLYEDLGTAKDVIEAVFPQHQSYASLSYEDVASYAKTIIELAPQHVGEVTVRAVNRMPLPEAQAFIKYVTSEYHDHAKDLARSLVSAKDWQVREAAVHHLSENLPQQAWQIAAGIVTSSSREFPIYLSTIIQNTEDEDEIIRITEEALSAKPSRAYEIVKYIQRGISQRGGDASRLKKDVEHTAVRSMDKMGVFFWVPSESLVKLIEYQKTTEAAEHAMRVLRAHLENGSQVLSAIYDLDPIVADQALALLQEQGIDTQALREEIVRYRIFRDLSEAQREGRQAEVARSILQQELASEGAVEAGRPIYSLTMLEIDPDMLDSILLHGLSSSVYDIQELLQQTLAKVPERWEEVVDICFARVNLAADVRRSEFPEETSTAILSEMLQGLRKGVTEEIGTPYVLQKALEAYGNNNPAHFTSAALHSVGDPIAAQSILVQTMKTSSESTEEIIQSAMQRQGDQPIDLDVLLRTAETILKEKASSHDLVTTLYFQEASLQGKAIAAFQNIVALYPHLQQECISKVYATVDEEVAEEFSEFLLRSKATGHEIIQGAINAGSVDVLALVEKVIMEMKDPEEVILALLLSIEDRPDLAEDLILRAQRAVKYHENRDQLMEMVAQHGYQKIAEIKARPWTMPAYVLELLSEDKLSEASISLARDVMLNRLRAEVILKQINEHSRRLAVETIAQLERNGFNAEVIEEGLVKHNLTEDFEHAEDQEKFVSSYLEEEARNRWMESENPIRSLYITEVAPKYLSQVIQHGISMRAYRPDVLIEQAVNLYPQEAPAIIRYAVGAIPQGVSSRMHPSDTFSSDEMVGLIIRGACKAQRDSTSRNEVVSLLLEEAYARPEIDVTDVVKGALYDNPFAHELDTEKMIHRAASLLGSGREQDLIESALVIPTRGYPDTPKPLSAMLINQVSMQLANLYPDHLEAVTKLAVKNHEMSANSNSSVEELLKALGEAYPEEKHAYVAGALEATPSAKRQDRIALMLEVTGSRKTVLEAVIEKAPEQMIDSTEWILAKAGSRDEVFDLLEVAVKHDPKSANAILDSALRVVEEVPGYTEEFPETLRKYVEILQDKQVQ